MSLQYLKSERPLSNTSIIELLKGFHADLVYKSVRKTNRKRRWSNIEKADMLMIEGDVSVIITPKVGKFDPWELRVRLTKPNANVLHVELSETIFEYIKKTVSIECERVRNQQPSAAARRAA